MTKAEVSAKIKKIVEQASASRPTIIEPELIFGWKEGEVIDFNEYEKIGFYHPKEKSTYSMDNQFFQELYDLIKEREEIDDPIILYPYSVEDSYVLVVIDGATRLSIVSKVRNENPDFFKMIPVRYFNGTVEEAMGEMIRRNLENRTRPLTSYELVEAIKRFVNSNWNNNEISERLGINSVRVSQIRNAIESCQSEGLKTAFKENPDKMKLSTFLAACKNPVDEQNKVAEKVLSGTKVKEREVKKTKWSPDKICKRVDTFLSTEIEEWDIFLKEKEMLKFVDKEIQDLVGALGEFQTAIFCAFNEKE